MPHTLLPQIGKAIASIGTQHFTHDLHGLIAAQLRVDAVHLQSVARLCSTLVPHPPFEELISSRRDAPPCDEALQLCSQDTSEYFQHRIVALRSATAQAFSEQERGQLNDLAPLLFSLLDRHVQVHQGLGDSSGTIEVRFQERLRETGIRLSEREQQVCLGLLAGHTVPQQAEQLMLTPHTVGSYLRRAAAKLGISGRNALMRWLYEAPEGQVSTH